MNEMKAKIEHEAKLIGNFNLIVARYLISLDIVPVDEHMERITRQFIEVLKMEKKI